MTAIMCTEERDDDHDEIARWEIKDLTAILSEMKT